MFGVLLFELRFLRENIHQNHLYFPNFEKHDYLHSIAVSHLPYLTGLNIVQNFSALPVRNICIL